MPDEVTPNPGSTPKPILPDTEIAAPRAISPSTFYGPSVAPALPARPKNNGSSNTIYIPPRSPAPRYDGFREPELVEDTIMDTDSIPELVHSDWTPWGTNFTPSLWNSILSHKRVKIDGRSIEEEQNWWDSDMRVKYPRPGPGYLTPVLLERFNDLRPIGVNLRVVEAPTSETHAEQIPPPPTALLSPTPAELTATVHPDVYYFPAVNSWAYLKHFSSNELTSLGFASSFVHFNLLPNQENRKSRGKCGEHGTYMDDNRTHHWHYYHNAIDGSKQSPPFFQSAFDLNVPEGEISLLDLFICCQCSSVCILSDLIPGTIPPAVMEAFLEEKKQHPGLDKTPAQSMHEAMFFVRAIFEDQLTGNQSGLRLRTTSRPFQDTLGLSDSTRAVFTSLGYTIVQDQVQIKNSQPPATKMEFLLQAPRLDNTESGKRYQRGLVRACVDIAVWLKFQEAAGLLEISSIKPARIVKTNKWFVVETRGFEDTPNESLGHVAQLWEKPPVVQALAKKQDLAYLGLTPMTATIENIEFAYVAQCRCDPLGTTRYLTHLLAIVETMQAAHFDSSDLQTMIIEERELSRFTEFEQREAAATLGFGADRPLGIEYDDEVDEDFLVRAWQECRTRARRNPITGEQLEKEANRAFDILAMSRGSSNLKKIHDDSKLKSLTVDGAYLALEAYKDTDDAMIIVVYGLRMLEQPMQAEKFREALSTIADARDSERLREFLKTDVDPGEITIPISHDLPRGLNQLGNTCYLNSLLQYFYTIKELREAVLPVAGQDVKSLEDDKFTDEELKRHRVGGRLVTRREIIRSKKFVHQLADLFVNMEHSHNPAVTPTIELAKLALVTSRDEEEDEGGTASSNDTDATLVDENSQAVSFSVSPVQSPGSVLGKRLRGVERQPSAMDVDDGFVMVSTSQTSTPSTPPPESRTEASSSQLDGDGDVAMPDTPPPLEPRPPPLPPRNSVPETNDSLMMFGKQHDVAECMDNCMFQIETALLKFDDGSSSQGSIVKRLFYGKLKQRVEVAADSRLSRSSVHEKEDIFSHLPVNVADDGVDIYDGLSGYFDDVVEFEGKKARMEVSIVDLPPLLQIQLQRVQFNRDTLQPYKSQAYVKFGETIYMDRFLDSADPDKKARSKSVQHELSACRERLRLIMEGKEGPSEYALINTIDFLASTSELLNLTDSPALLVDLREEPEKIRAEVAELRTCIDRLKAELENIWGPDSTVAYELTSVFIHRGSSPSFGHYFFYSRNLPDEPDSWFKYNDSDVTVVSKEEVMADTTGSTANPYLLVFARKGSAVVNTVNRFKEVA